MRSIIETILNEKFLSFVIIAMLISYFYNLPVLKYSALGDNEFRLYDIAGIFILFYFIKYFKFLKIIIFQYKVFKLFFYFTAWSGFMLLPTLFFSMINEKIIYFFQVGLYWFHLCVFFSTSIFVFLFTLKIKYAKRYITLLIVLSIIVCLIVILQNFKIIPFLWNDIYFTSYAGFLSGTLGPNKILLGVTSFFMLVFSLTNLIENNYRINKILLFLTVFLNLYVVILSGSRTTYTALAVFFIFYLFRKTFNFLMSSIILGGIFIVALTISPQLRDKLNETFEKRITNYIQVNEENELTDDSVTKLSSGRNRLHYGNLMYLIDNPQIIPFGMGFVNRFSNSPGLSAHNMYLQVIRELGLLGFFLYFGWLFSYLLIDFKNLTGYSLGLKGLIFSMLVSLYFGEHLYIYRPTFGLLGLFLVICVLFLSVLHNRTYFESDGLNHEN